MASKGFNIALAFVPVGVTILAGELANRDKNTTGADDAFAEVLKQIAPVLPQLIDGEPNQNAADKVFLALNKVSAEYIKQRGLTPLVTV